MSKIILIILVGLVFIAKSALYIVDEREIAIKFKLGEIISIIEKPGIYFKTPFVNNVLFLDKRIQTLDERPDRFLTGEKKNVIVDSYVKWKIVDAKKFYTSTGGDVDTANSRLSEVIKEGLRNEFGKRTIVEVVHGERNEVMNNMTKIAKESAKEFGINVVDLRIKRIDLSREVNNSVYARMSAERLRVAKDLRAKGAESAEIIQAKADKKRSIILANAYRDAEKIKGDGDAKASRLYAEVFTKNKKFYSFYRSLEAYKKSFGSKNDMMVLNPKSEFFRYFNPVIK
ncbi:HflC protein [hydrothermal vent metagenome]|uniref:HflC protein n=1 Tax=hydrothermal vent metagenome TaxID=652676 RepID=A0A1W1BN39_9ZZZZ